MTVPEPRPTLQEEAFAALMCPDAEAKVDRVDATVRRLASGALRIATDFITYAAAAPGRPEQPELVPPRALARRSAVAGEGHAALVHAMAHIEFNAINLALDAVCRFPGLPEDYYRDWLRVAAEEALHFRLLRDHLREGGRDYGSFPAHDGLWQMALKTGHDPLIRMALVPRVMEARGLDASPGIIRRLRENGDARGAQIVEIILRDEVDHVAIGTRWFNHLCATSGLHPEEMFEHLLDAYDAPRPVMPINSDARRRASFTPRELQLVEALALGRSTRGAG